jgi:hypothetical protein
VKALVWIYLTCLGVAALVFAIFPAQDTYINPVEVRPVETRVERIVPDPVNLSQQIEVNVRETASLESRVTTLEKESGDGLAIRVDLAGKAATEALTSVDKLGAKTAVMERGMETEQTNRKGNDVILAILALAGVALAITALIVNRRGKCDGKPTSAGTPTRR